MAVFRGKLLAALRTALHRGSLQLPETLRPQQVLNLLNCLGHPQKTRWNVHIMARYPHGVGVATYLARSLRDEIERRIVEVTAGRWRRPVLILGIDGA